MGRRFAGGAAGAALAVLVGLAVSGAPSAAQAPASPSFLDLDDAQLHGTITPPGADTRHATAELDAYDYLVQGYPTLTEDELRNRYFKTRLFGPVDRRRAHVLAARRRDA